jgi:hypothetical protein
MLQRLSDNRSDDTFFRARTSHELAPYWAPPARYQIGTVVLLILVVGLMMLF